MTGVQPLEMGTYLSLLADDNDAKDREFSPCTESRGPAD